jgi:uncharacterized protein YrrD
MIRGRDVLRLPVIGREDGTKIGQVEDLVIDRNGTRVLGVVVHEEGVLRPARVVAWQGVLAVGLDAVIIDSERSVVKAPELPEINEVLDRGFLLQGSRVQTTAGRDLGKIENFYFDGVTGAVEGYELVGGVNNQQPSGSSFLPTPPGFESGKDYTFVDPSAADTVEDLATGLNRRGK